MKTLVLVVLATWLSLAKGQANETYKACQTVMTCFQDAEDEIDKCLGILVGERTLFQGATTEQPKRPQQANPDDCMGPVKEKLKQKKVLDRERLQEFKSCLTLRIDAGAEDVDPRKYRYCSTVTGRYQNKTSESSARVRRQALPELPPQSTSQAPSNSTEPSSPIIAPHSTPIQGASANSLGPRVSQEPKNATSGGGVDLFPLSSNVTHISSSPSSLSPISAGQSIIIGSSSSSSAGVSEISTHEITGITKSESGQPKSENATTQIGGLSVETTTAKLSGPSSIPHSSSNASSQSQPSQSQPAGTLPHSLFGSVAGVEVTTKAKIHTTTEIEYEESGVSGGSSSAEIGAPKNPIVEALNRQNVSEPIGPPLESNYTATEGASESTIHQTSPTTTTLHPPGGAPGARSPGSRQSVVKPQRPVQQASDIDANGSDQESQQRVKVEILREARRRLSEFKGCMARARIKREECKPLVRCCPDTAVCHLNYEASELHDKVHKLEAEIVQGRQECVKRKRALNKDELADALDQIDAEELISDDSVVSQIIF